MSKIAKKIAEHLNSSIGFEELLDILVDIDTAEGRDAFAELIDQALEGKIISKSEVDALRKDAENMQSAQDAYNYTESLNADLRRQNSKLNQENVNLKLDNYALKQFPQVYYATDWSFEKSWTGTTIPLIRERGQNIHKCDICGVIEPENATHGHSGFEKFVRRLKFWR